MGSDVDVSKPKIKQNEMIMSRKQTDAINDVTSRYPLLENMKPLSTVLAEMQFTLNKTQEERIEAIRATKRVTRKESSSSPMRAS